MRDAGPTPRAADAAPRTARSRRELAGLAVGFVVVLAAAWFGIWSRASENLASFWPANAILLGVLVRWPRLRTASTWIGAAIGYVVADVSTGSDLGLTIGLSAANLAGAAVGLALMRNWDAGARRLAHPRAVLELIGVCAAAGLAATAVGVPVGVWLLDFSAWSSTQVWFSAEFATYLAVLPFLLSFPRRDATGTRRADRPWRSMAIGVAALVPVLALGVLVGGPGALAFSVPVLLWSSLRGDVFVTSGLVLLAAVWNLMALSSGLLEVELSSAGSTAKISLQLGLALTSMGPLTVAAATRAREDLLSRIRDLADRDELTGVRNRRGFLGAADVELAEAWLASEPVGLLMLDLDEFKAVNDRFGHDAGDALLREVGSLLTSAASERDVVGRLGGEEFAVLVRGERSTRADEVARRILERIRALRVGPVVSVTASIGVVVVVPEEDTALSALMSEADRRLYRAKRDGRDRVHTVE